MLSLQAGIYRPFFCVRKSSHTILALGKHPPGFGNAFLWAKTHFRDLGNAFLLPKSLSQDLGNAILRSKHHSLSLGNAIPDCETYPPSCGMLAQNAKPFRRNEKSNRKMRRMLFF